MQFLNRQNLTRTTERRDLTPRRVDGALIENILAALAAKLPEKDRLSLAQHSDVAILENHWPDIVGPINAAHSRPARISGNTLLIACDHSIFAEQIQMMQTKIFKEAQERLGSQPKKIRTFIQPNIWENTVIDKRKTGDIISKSVKVVAPENIEEIEKKKILDALEKEFKNQVSQMNRLKQGSRHGQ